MREFWQKLPYSNLTMKTNGTLKCSGLLLWLKSEVSLAQKFITIGEKYDRIR